MMNRSATDETASAEKRGWKRRRTYIVDPAFQWKYALMVGVAVFLLSALMSFVLYGILHRQARMRVIHPESYVAGLASVIFFTGLAFSVLTAGSVAVWTILMTHRMCGPLMVMGRVLSELGEGRMPKMRPLRKKDEFKDFFNILARAVDTLKENKQAELNAFNEALATAQSAAGSNDEDRRSALASITSQLETLRGDAVKSLGEENCFTPSDSTILAQACEETATAAS